MGALRAAGDRLRPTSSGRLPGMSFTHTELDAATSVVRRHFPATPQLSGRC